MASEPNERYLFAGDVEGRLHQLFKRVAAVNKANGPFDCLFCVGAFFPPATAAGGAASEAVGQSELEEYIAGRAKAPLPTFFIGDLGLGAQRLLELAERATGGAEKRGEGKAGEEQGEAEGKREGDVEAKGEAEGQGEGEGKREAETGAEGEGEENGNKADGEGGEGAERKGEAGEGRHGEGPGGEEIKGETEEEEAREGEWYSHKRVKICDNIEWLRGAGIADLCGLKVAYLGGRYDPATYLSGQAAGKGDGGGGVGAGSVGQQERGMVEALVDAGADVGAVDVLLSNQWPKGVAALTHPDLLPASPPATSAAENASVDWADVGSPVAATLAKELMPRYHVAGGAGIFFARPPYINSSATSAADTSTSATGPVTRFIGLAPVGNKTKQKFLHALSLKPASSLPLSALAAPPPDATPSPFLPRPAPSANQIWSGSLATPDGAARAAAAAAQAKAEESAAKRTFWEGSEGGKDAVAKPAWALKVEEEEKRGGGGGGGEEGQYWRYAAGNKRARRDGGRGGGRGGDEGPRLCFELSAKGECSRGEACRFKHTLEDGTPLPRNLCFEHLSKGSCSRGAECRFKHSLTGGEEGGGAGGGGGGADRDPAAAAAGGAGGAAAGSSGGVVSELPKGVCFDFIRKGSCTREDTCRFTHSLPSSSPGLLATPPALPPSSSLLPLAPQAALAAAAGVAAPRAPAPCWFCLSSPKVESHLVVAVGDHCYLALPKGPLVPGHVLILPIEHFPNAVSLPSDALLEMGRYVGALRRCFEAQGRTLVAFERFLQLRAATHAHINVVPIPHDKASELLPAFTAAATSHGFQFTAVPKPPESKPMAAADEIKRVSLGGQYLSVELPDGSLLVHGIQQGARIPLQLGREVVAAVLGVAERGDWRACKETVEEETTMADAFKKQFQPFDFMG